jgi:CheY-like chemotaxis protein
LLGRKSFDLLLTDVALPDGSGLELAREAVARHKELRVVLATGQVMEAMEDLPGASWLPKPYDERALAVAVGTWPARSDGGGS